MRSDLLEILVGPERVVAGEREVRLRFGVAVRLRFDGVPRRLGVHGELLLEQRVHGDRRGAGVLEPADQVHVIDERRRAGDQRVRQRQSEVGGRRGPCSVLRDGGRPRRAGRRRPVRGPRQLFERREPGADGGLALPRQLARPRRILLLDQPEARLVAGELLERDLRRAGVEDQRARRRPRRAAGRSDRAASSPSRRRASAGRARAPGRSRARCTGCRR